jgi:antitoxin HicB
MTKVKNINYYLSLPYTTILRRDEDGDILARIEELPGCMTHGADEAEAIANLASLKELWLKDALDNREEIPEPQESEPLPSGKWLQRVPRSLHLQLTKQAAKEGVSLNQLVTSILAQQLTPRAIARAVEEIARRSGPSARGNARGYFADIGNSTKRAPNNAIPVNFLQWAHPRAGQLLTGKEDTDVRDSKDKLYYEDKFSYDA